MKGRSGDPWMPASIYGKGLSGLSVNLLVKDVAASVTFAETVFDAKPVYADPDFAVLKIDTPTCVAEWMLHAHHTYAGHPLLGLIHRQDGQGLGAEFRLHGLNPDDAESRARAAGYTVLAGSADKAHGLREAYILDDDGYCWTPDRPLST